MQRFHVVAEAEAVLGAEVEPVLDEELEAGGLHDVVLGAEDEQVVRGDPVQVT